MKYTQFFKLVMIIMMNYYTNISLSLDAGQKLNHLTDHLDSIAMATRCSLFLNFINTSIERI